VRREYNNYYKNEFLLDICLVAYWLIPLALNVGIFMGLTSIAGKMDILLATAFGFIMMMAASTRTALQTMLPPGSILYSIKLFSPS
jgi:hypothetical protein